MKLLPSFGEASGMGLARELTMGPKRKGAQRPGSAPDYAALKRLTTAPVPDLETFRALLDRVGNGGRMRYAEGLIYTVACARYSALSGEQYGPTVGTY